MKKSELKQLILEAYNEVLLLAKLGEELTEDLSFMDEMFDDPNIRYNNADSTLICTATHPKFGAMPVYNLTIKVNRDIQKAGLLKFITTSGSGIKFKAKSFKSVLLMVKNVKLLVKNVRVKRDGIGIKLLATKINKFYDKMIFDAAKQSGLDLRRSK